MAKYHRISWSSVFFIGTLFLISPSVLAEIFHPSNESGIVECQTALEKFSLRLEERSRGRPQQTYYANLYRQTQDFLASLKTFPTPSLDKCQNFLNVVRDIVGVDLDPMPHYSGQQDEGHLAKPILKTSPKRELRSVRYEYTERVKPTQEKKGMGEEGEDFEELPFSPPPTRRSSKIGNHIPSEAKDYEPKF